MKRLYISILSLLITFSLIGCSSTKNISSTSEPAVTTTKTTVEEITEEVTEVTVVTTTAPLPVECISVEKNLLEKTITDDDDSVLINASYELPVIKNDNNDPAVQAIIDFYQKASDEWFAFYETTEKTRLKEEKEFDPEHFSAVTVERSFEVTYNNFGILSVLQLQYDNYNGAHPNTTRFSNIFDLHTGGLLTLTDILNGTSEEIDAMITADFAAKIKKAPDEYHQGAKKMLAEIPYSAFYLNDKDKTLRISYQTDEIAPYAAGYPEISLDYTDTAKFKIKLK